MQRCRLLRSREGKKGISEERAATVVIVASLLSPPPPPPPLLLQLLLLLAGAAFDDDTSTMSTSTGLKHTPQSVCAGSDRRCDSSSSKKACGAGG